MSGHIQHQGGGAGGVLRRQQLQQLLSEVDPTAAEKLTPEVEEVLLDIADEFVETATRFSCDLARHRGGSTVEARDLKLHLERSWHMNIPMGAINSIDGGAETKKTTRKSSKGADKGANGAGGDSYRGRLEAVKQEQQKLKDASSS